MDLIRLPSYDDLHEARLMGVECSILVYETIWGGYRVKLVPEDRMSEYSDVMLAFSPFLTHNIYKTMFKPYRAEYHSNLREFIGDLHELW